MGAGHAAGLTRHLLWVEIEKVIKRFLKKKKKKVINGRKKKSEKNIEMRRKFHFKKNLKI